MTARILIADDEPLYLRTTGDLLRNAGYECVCVSDAHQAMLKLNEETFNLVLSDLNMPGNLKLELLEHSRRTHGTPIVVITGVPSLPSAIESIRLGITDYLLKPVKKDDLLASVRRALESSQRQPTDKTLHHGKELRNIFPGIVGESQPMLELFEIIERVATTDTNVLITGESGTGKEIVAKAIHDQSHRREHAFQVIDCTAFPESLFESILFGHKKGSFTGAVSDRAGLLKQCDKGTAFFDELGELPLSLQAKLLRAVQEQTFVPVGSHTPEKVNTRFICATNRDLEIEVNAGRFRQDLFYRLGVIHIELPPLRERGDDILLLVDHFLTSLQPDEASVVRVTEEAASCLARYSWPGNIRELRNVIERTLTLARGDVIDIGDLPKNITSPPNDTATMGASSTKETTTPDKPASSSIAEIVVGRETLTDASREEALDTADYQYLANLLQMHSGNVSEAARQAGLSRQGLHKLLNKHGLRASEFRD